MRTSAVFIALLCVLSLLPAADLPGDYRGLRFGADTADLSAAFPKSENQRFSLEKRPALSGPGVDVFCVAFRKGMADSAWIYFTGNRFAMAVEYCYPGEEYYRKTVSQLAGRYGQFVGAGLSFFKRQKGKVLHVGYRKKAGMAVVTWMDEALSEELRRSSTDSAAAVIDRQLEEVKQSLDSLEKDGKNQGKAKR